MFGWLLGSNGKLKVKKINDTISVSPQISTEDMAALSDQGFRSIICNRPDGESAGQPTFAEIKKAARKAGLKVRYIPIGPGQVGETQVRDFTDAMTSLPLPALAYCRSGARSSMIHSFYQRAR